jgi:ligand-binding sensor domain-containing protein/signal transduction histidine kinase
MRPSSRHTIYFIFLNILFLTGNDLNAQHGGQIFYNLTTTNGLSSNRATSVIQDKQGFYWIATLDGLNRFDGTSCKVFQNVEQDTMSLSDNNCISLLEDDNGDIWIATLMGLNRYRNDGKFDRYFFHNPNENFERVNWIWGMTKDSSGNIWISSCGLWQYNIYTKKWRQWLHDPGDPASIPNGIVASPLFDKRTNYIWLTGSNGFIVFDITTSKFYHRKNNPRNITLLNEMNFGSPTLLDNHRNIWYFTHHVKKPLRYSIEKNTIDTVPVKVLNGVFSLNRDNRNRIWMNYWHGPTYIYDPSNNSIDSVFLDRYHPQSAISNHAKNLFIDRSGNYWISTWKGVSIFNPRAQSIKYHQLENNPNNPIGDAFAITAVVEQSDSVLWLGTTAGLYQYNLRQRKLSYRKMPLRNNFGHVRNLFFQSDSILWIAGWTEVLCYDIKSNKLIDTFYEIDLPQCTMKDAQGNIWVGTWNNGLFKISASRNIVGHFMPGPQSPENIYNDNLVCFGDSREADYAWVGYNGGHGFSLINFSTQRFKHYKIKVNKQDHLPTYSTNCIVEDENRNLWVGTFGRGLIHFNPKDETYKVIMQSDGLKGNFINSILVDNDSRLWVSTTTGISIVDTKNHDIIQTDIDLNFTSNDFVDNGLVRKNGSFLFFAGTRIVEIDPVKYYNTPKNSEIVISSFKVFNKEAYFPLLTSKEQTVKLTHRQNFFSFDYSLLKPNPNSLTQYAYQLEGFDKEWNYVRERHTAFYTNVTPGNYKFHVKATDENGHWIYSSKPLSIVITTPFWQQWWFIALLILLALAGLYAFYRYRLGEVKKIFNLREKISQDLHDEVGSALSGISLLGHIAQQQLKENRIDESTGLINKISGYCDDMVNRVSDIVWSVNPQNESLDKMLNRLQSYASSVAGAQNVQFNFRNETVNSVKKMKMPVIKNIYLICKEALNNALKYSQCRTLNCFLYSTDNRFQVLIEDDGNGFDLQKANDGNGLKNIQKRADEIHALLNIQSAPGEGTKIFLELKTP